MAANVLGVVHLQREDFRAARAAFEDAAGAHPRTVRPLEYAMARSNLALACERDGLLDHARLAARQALAIDGAAPQVRRQAEQVLAELGDDDGALLVVLEGLDRDARIGTLRAEFGRLVTDLAAMRRHAAVLVDGLAAGGAGEVELAEAWLEVVLEQPPEPFRTIVQLVVEADADTDSDGARRAISRAMGRFHVPQWMRLKDTFNAVAGARGEDPAWG